MRVLEEMSFLPAIPYRSKGIHYIFHWQERYGIELNRMFLLSPGSAVIGRCAQKPVLFKRAEIVASLQDAAHLPCERRIFFADEPEHFQARPERIHGGPYRADGIVQDLAWHD